MHTNKDEDCWEREIPDDYRPEEEPVRIQQLCRALRINNVREVKRLLHASYLPAKSMYEALLPVFLGGGDGGDGDDGGDGGDGGERGEEIDLRVLKVLASDGRIMPFLKDGRVADAFCRRGSTRNLAWVLGNVCLPEETIGLIFTTACREHRYECMKDILYGHRRVLLPVFHRELADAAAAGDTDLVRNMLSVPYPLSAEIDHGQALVCATDNGHRDIVCMLLLRNIGQRGWQWYHAAICADRNGWTDVMDTVIISIDWNETHTVVTPLVNYNLYATFGRWLSNHAGFYLARHQVMYICSCAKGVDIVQHMLQFGHFDTAMNWVHAVLEAALWNPLVGVALTVLDSPMATERLSPHIMDLDIDALVSTNSMEVIRKILTKWPQLYAKIHVLQIFSRYILNYPVVVTELLRDSKVIVDKKDAQYILRYQPPQGHESKRSAVSRARGLMIIRGFGTRRSHGEVPDLSLLPSAATSSSPSWLSFVNHAIISNLLRNPVLMSHPAATFAPEWRNGGGKMGVLFSASKHLLRQRLLMDILTRYSREIREMPVDIQIHIFSFM